MIEIKEHPKAEGMCGIFVNGACIPYQMFENPIVNLTEGTVFFRCIIPDKNMANNIIKPCVGHIKSFKILYESGDSAIVELLLSKDEMHNYNVDGL